MPHLQPRKGRVEKIMSDQITINETDLLKSYAEYFTEMKAADVGDVLSFEQFKSEWEHETGVPIRRLQRKSQHNTHDRRYNRSE